MSDNSLYQAALNRAMALCSSREYCCDDIRTKLKNLGLEGADCEKALEVLKKEKFIDEERYSAAYARDKFRYNKWGKIKIAAGLRQRKIPEDLIIKALHSIDNEEYTNLIKNLIEAQRKKVKSKNPYEMKAKLMRFGLSKGFESNLIYEIIGDPEN